MPVTGTGWSTPAHRAVIRALRRQTDPLCSGRWAWSWNDLPVPCQEDGLSEVNVATADDD
jgi:hypothetical protein